MGAEALKKLLERLDMDELLDKLYTELRETRSKQKQKEIIKRLKTGKALKDSGLVITTVCQSSSSTLEHHVRPRKASQPPLRLERRPEYRSPRVASGLPALART